MTKEKWLLTCMSNASIKCRSLTRIFFYCEGTDTLHANTQTKIIVIWTIKNKMNNIDNSNNNNNDYYINNKVIIIIIVIIKKIIVIMIIKIIRTRIRLMITVSQNNWNWNWINKTKNILSCQLIINKIPHAD